jgi:hypothetical protein
MLALRVSLVDLELTGGEKSQIFASKTEAIDPIAKD